MLACPPALSSDFFSNSAISVREGKSSMSSRFIQFECKALSWMSFFQTDTVSMAWLRDLQEAKLNTANTGIFPELLSPSLPCGCLLTHTTCTMTGSRHASFTALELEARYMTHTPSMKIWRKEVLGSWRWQRTTLVRNELYLYFKKKSFDFIDGRNHETEINRFFIYIIYLQIHKARYIYVDISFNCYS